MQLNIPYVFNNTQGAHYNRLADVAIALGLQVVEQKRLAQTNGCSFSIAGNIPYRKI